MKVIPTEIPDVLLLEPDVFRDARGFFLETYHLEKYRALGLTEPFVQDNQSRSGQNTLRGLHAQKDHPQGKLVRAVRGEIWDVAVDLRRHSPTFGKWASATLSEDNLRQLWVPPGFAHGFCVLSEFADVEYKCTALYDRADEIGVRWDDPDLCIEWPVGRPLLSPKDLTLPLLRSLAL